MTTSKSQRNKLGLVLLIALVALAILYNSILNPWRFNVTRFVQYQNAADDAYGKNDYSTAEINNRAALKEAEKKSPENEFVIHALHGLGNTYLARKRYEDAEATFQRQIAVAEDVYGQERPDRSFPLLDLAVLYIEQGRFDEASDMIQKALKISERGVDQAHAAAVDMAKAMGEISRTKTARKKD